MRILILLPLLISGCLFPIKWDQVVKPKPSPVPINKPTELYGITLDGIELTKDQKQYMSAMYAEYAKQIAFDGTRSEPKLMTTLDANQRFGTMNDYAAQGPNTNATTALRTLHKTVVEKELMKDGEYIEVTPEVRSKIVKIFEAFAYVLGT